MNDYEITIEMLKTRCHQHQAEEKRLKEEIYEFDPLTGGLSEKKKLDVANKKLLDFYQTMTEDQQQTLAFKKNCEDASPIDHQDIIAWMTQLLKERDEFEEENEELKEKITQLSASVSADVWSPIGLLNILENQDLTWTESLDAVKKLKEENETLQRRATMYEYMSEFMEKSDTFSAYFDYIREYYPDERKEAGDLV